MPDTEEQRRKQAIARYLADDKIEDICKAIGGSKSWLYKWRDRYQADDPHRQRAHQKTEDHPAKTPKTIEQAVVSLRRALCQSGVWCCGHPAGARTARSRACALNATIYRILHRHQKEVPKPTSVCDPSLTWGMHPAMLRLFHP